MDDPGFTPIARVENTAPMTGNCPVCSAVHVPMASICGVVVCTGCRDDVVGGIIQGARDHRLVRRTHGRMD